MGYYRAGFDVIGLDIAEQPRYPFPILQAEAVAFLREYAEPIRAYFDAVHASPPCQAFSAGGHLWASRQGPTSERHPDLIAETRAALRELGLPYVIENVERAPLLDAVTVCGLSLGVNVKRHRLFEATFPLLVPPCHSKHDGDWITVFGGGALTRTPKGGQARRDGKHNGRGNHDGRRHLTHAEASEAMGIDWMNRDELSEAIPPAYTELVGYWMMQIVTGNIARKVAGAFHAA